MLQSFKNPCSFTEGIVCLTNNELEGFMKVVAFDLNL